MDDTARPEVVVEAQLEDVGVGIAVERPDRVVRAGTRLGEAASDQQEVEKDEDACDGVGRKAAGPHARSPAHQLIT